MNFFMKRIFRLCEKLYPVYHVDTIEELKEAGRFRHEIYIEEMGLIEDDDKLETKEMYHEDEIHGNSHVFYTKKHGKITSTFGIICSPKGQASDAMREKYDLHHLQPALDYPIIEVSRLMIRQKSRHTVLLLCLFRHIAHLTIEQFKVPLIFFSCEPDLVHVYKRIGAKLYTSHLIQQKDRVEIPMVIDSFINRHLDLHTPVCDIFEDSPSVCLSEREQSPFKECYNTIEAKSVQHNDTIYKQALAQKIQAHGIFATLSNSQIKEIVGKSTILSCRTHAQLLMKGQKCHSVFIPMQDKSIATTNDNQVYHAHDGDVIAPYALDTGKSNATITVKKDSDVLVINYKILDKILEQPYHSTMAMA